MDEDRILDGIDSQRVEHMSAEAGGPSATEVTTQQKELLPPGGGVPHPEIPRETSITIGNTTHGGYRRYYEGEELPALRSIDLRWRQKVDDQGKTYWIPEKSPGMLGESVENALMRVRGALGRLTGKDQSKTPGGAIESFTTLAHSLDAYGKLDALNEPQEKK